MRKDLARRDFSDSYVLYNVSTLVSAYPYVSKLKTCITSGNIYTLFHDELIDALHYERLLDSLFFFITYSSIGPT